MQQEILINEGVLERFARLSDKGRLAHAYLFIGPPAIGKYETALAAAKMVNCETKGKRLYCDTCPSCVKIDAGNHPDIFVIDNEPGELIKIEQMRELLSRDRLRPFMASKKVFIVRNIEGLTLDAANAFLKTLEEPSADSLLLLTTSVVEKNLDTIRSRCHNVYFPGDPGADRFKDAAFIKHKNNLITRFVLNRPDDAAVKELISDKILTGQFLNILLSWTRDAILAKAGVEDARLVHRDRLDDLKKFTERFSFEELNQLNASVVHMHKLLADNLNIKLPLLIIGEQLWRK